METNLPNGIKLFLAVFMIIVYALIICAIIYAAIKIFLGNKKKDDSDRMDV